MRSTLFTLLFFFSTIYTNAQMGSAKQVTWSYNAKKIANNIFELSITANIAGNYHLYAIKAGVEGPVPTTINFNPNPLITLEGSIIEKGKKITKLESAWGGNVNFFEKTVTFTQKAKTKTNAKTNVNGKIQFMVCNDEMCLPPSEITFKIPIGG